jgi:2-polyprenyl-3-methyl-5-hydroxy-6-metoxy-1,4-benzoquinol methylase
MTGERPDGDPAHAFDAAYARWKRWHGQGAFYAARKDAKYFRGEFRGIRLRGARVLELGFGNGTFLAWARSEGAEVTGTELNAFAVQLGRERGFDVHAGAVDEIPALAGARFDLVVAIDVLEHLDDGQLGRSLRWIAEHLSEEGVCVARVPNAASPFGLPVQCGDLTHRQALSCEKFRQLASIHDFELVRCANQYRSWAGGIPALRQAMQRSLRRALEALFRFALELRDTPLDMNIVVTLRAKRPPR